MFFDICWRIKVSKNICRRENIWFREKFGPGSFSRRLAGEVDQFTAKYTCKPIPLITPLLILILNFILILFFYVTLPCAPQVAFHILAAKHAKPPSQPG